MWQRYFNMDPAPEPELIWDPEAKRLRIEVNKRTQQIRYSEETEDSVWVTIEPIPVKDAPITDKLKPI